MRADKVKYLAGIIFRDGREDSLEKALDHLQETVSRIDFRSRHMDFNFTDYYYPEMGKPLKRVFVSFSELCSASRLADVKNTACRLEEHFSIEGRRVVNIDPGYMEQSKLVLASTKNFYHRIYLGKGIFGEVTLSWKGGGFQDFPWTFPDFRTSDYKGILEKIRGIYRKQIKEIA